VGYGVRKVLLGGSARKGKLPEAGRPVKRRDAKTLKEEPHLVAKGVKETLNKLVEGRD